MEPITLTYTAPPGQLTIEDMTNVNPCRLSLKGYAIPAHPDVDGWMLAPGFDVISIQLAQESEFASAQALVCAPAGRELHWSQCRQAVQWADEKAAEIT